MVAYIPLEMVNLYMMALFIINSNNQKYETE